MIQHSLTNLHFVPFRESNRVAEDIFAAGFYEYAWPYPPVFDLLIVALCARRLCFFLASRISAYLLTTCGVAACFSDFAWAFGCVLGSAPSIGVVLIFLSLIAQNAAGLLSVNLLPWNHAGLKKLKAVNSRRSQWLSTVHTTRLVAGRDGTARGTHGL